MERQKEMDAELAELAREDDGDHNLEAERDRLNMEARSLANGSGREGRTYMRPTENYDSEPDSPRVDPISQQIGSNGYVVKSVEYGSEREDIEE